MTTEDCVFCRIFARETPGTIVHEDADIVAFLPLERGAHFHVMVSPRRHVTSVAELDDVELAGRVLLRAAQIGREAGYRERGFRLVTNVPGPDNDGGVPHLHVHVYAGQRLGYPVRHDPKQDGTPPG